MGTIAREFKDKPNILYSLWNEPNGDMTPEGKGNYERAWESWLKIGIKIAQSIRDEDPKAILLVPGGRLWGRNLSYYQSHPFPFDNVIYNVHDYWAPAGYPYSRDMWTWVVGKYPLIVAEFGGVSGGRGTYNGEEDVRYVKEVIDIVNSKPLLIHYIAFHFSGCREGQNAPCLFMGNVNNPSALSGRGQVIFDDLQTKPPTKFR